MAEGNVTKPTAKSAAHSLTRLPCEIAKRLWICTISTEVSRIVLAALLAVTAWASPGMVFAGWELPYVPRADNAIQQGFVRLKNLSETAGVVSIRAIDDRGQIHGPVRISLDGNETRHFNSTDLENGNPAKGLSAGVGQGQGDWRLLLESDLPFEALAYIRTGDGFVTSVFETAWLWAPDIYWVPFFNPASNYRQVSQLRLVNTKGERASIAIAGLDDQGAWAPGGEVKLELGPRASRIITAQELEDGAPGLSGRLGNGSGKWRLWVQSDRRLHVQSLLESPTGNLTNLSTGHWFDGRDAPLALSAANPKQQGFVRVLNHTNQAGYVRISATDDSGATKEPVRLRLQARGASAFNATRLGAR